MPCSLATISTRSCCHTPTQLQRARAEGCGRSVSACDASSPTPGAKRLGVRRRGRHRTCRSCLSRARVAANVSSACGQRRLPLKRHPSQAHSPRSMPMATSLSPMSRAAMRCAEVSGRRSASRERWPKDRTRRAPATLPAQHANSGPLSPPRCCWPALSSLIPGRRSGCAMGLDGAQRKCSASSVQQVSRCSVRAGADVSAPPATQAAPSCPAATCCAASPGRLRAPTTRARRVAGKSAAATHGGARRRMRVALQARALAF